MDAALKLVEEKILQGLIMVNLKRYNIQVPNLLTNPWGYTLAKNGEWVKFNDIKELLNTSTNTGKTCQHSFFSRQTEFGFVECKYCGETYPIEAQRVVKAIKPAPQNNKVEKSNSTQQPYGVK